MSKHINLADAINSLTMDRKEYKKIHGRFTYLSGLKNDNPKKITLTDKPLCVDEKVFYDLIKMEFSELKHKIPDEYRLTRVFGESSQGYDLEIGPQIPSFNTIEEAAEIIKQQAYQIYESKLMNEKLNQSLIASKEKADKWDNWQATKGHKKKRFARKC